MRPLPDRLQTAAPVSLIERVLASYSGIQGSQWGEACHSRGTGGIRRVANHVLAATRIEEFSFFMRVTIVDSDVSYPATSGKRLRTLNLMLPLARRHAITYIGRGIGAPSEVEAQTFLRDHGITPIIVPEPLAAKSGAAFYARLAGNLMSSIPYSVASHNTPRMRAVAQEHLMRMPPDICQIEFLGYLYTADAFTGPKVLQAHNVESLIWKRYAETDPVLAKRLFSRGQYRKYLRCEGDAFREATRVVVVSDADKALAHSLYGDAAIDVVDNGVDVSGFASIARLPGSRQILFLGALDWRPNIDAVDVLLSDVFPIVRRLVPDATLAIVGRQPSKALVQRVAGSEGVRLHSDVPDVKPYLSSSAVMSVPLRIGGGSRLKILEALAAGLPVVSTTVGAEGLALEADRDIAIADGAVAHAESLVAALLEPAKAEALARSGRTKVQGRYGWEQLADRLERVWLEAAGQKTGRPHEAPHEAHETL